MGVWSWLLRRRHADPVIDSLIKKPVDRGFGRHDEAQEAAARQRRHRAEVLANDAARARLPRRLVFLEEDRGNVRGFHRG
jgi:hypothetical protein